MSPPWREPVPVDVRAPALRGPVMMNQRWLDLTFLHWAVDPGEVAGLLPHGVRPDTYEGRSYVGLVPFRMVEAGLGRGPGVPYLGSFLETNVRLYSVDEQGRRGIVFLSLDTDRSAVVAGARAAFGLPYRWARMRHWHVALPTEELHIYDARLRRAGSRPRSHIAVRVGGLRESDPLDEFLSARWGLHVRHLGVDLYVPNQHPPWQLRHAEVVALDDQLLSSVGLGRLAARPPDQVGFSDGVHTEFGLPARTSAEQTLPQRGGHGR